MEEIGVCALIEGANSEKIKRVLDVEIPNRTSLIEEFEFPQSSNNPTHVVHHYHDAIDYIFRNKVNEYHLAWSSAGPKNVRTLQADFIESNCVIMTFFLESDLSEMFLRSLNEKYRAQFAFCSEAIGLIENRVDFLEICKAACRPKLFDGIILT